DYKLAPVVRAHGLPATREPYRELAVFANLAFDRNAAAVLLRDDVVADRQAKAGALPGRLGGEERLEQLVPDLLGDADAVVANPDLHRVGQLTCRDAERGIEAGRCLHALAPARRIEPVAEQVQQHARDVLRHHRDGRDAFAEVALQRDVEVLI